MQVESAAAGRPWILEADVGGARFTAADIARIFGVPVPHIPGDTTTPPAPEAIQIGPTDIS